MYFHSHYKEYKNFIQDILIPFFLWLMFLPTQRKASSSVKSSKQNFHFINALNLTSIHSVYKLFKMPFCKKMMFFDVDFSLE